MGETYGLGEFVEKLTPSGYVRVITLYTRKRPDIEVQVGLGSSVFTYVAVHGNSELPMGGLQVNTSGDYGHVVPLEQLNANAQRIILMRVLQSVAFNSFVARVNKELDLVQRIKAGAAAPAAPLKAE